MATSAASAMAGNAGAGEPGAGGEGGAPPPNGGAPAVEKPWHETAGIDVKYAPAIAAKGWTSPNDVLESYTNVEKLVSMERGGDVDRILVKPKDDATPEERAAFVAKAGFAAPEKAEDYGFTAEKIGSKAGELFAAAGLPAELATKFAGEMTPVVAAAANWFKEAGVPTNLADGLVNQVLATEVEGLKAFHAKSDADYTALSTEMGDQFADFEEAGRRAFKASGLDTALLDKIEMAVGTKQMLQMFGKFGQAMKEGVAPNANREGGGNGFTQTAAGAKTRIDQLSKDSDFQAKLLSTNPEVRKVALAEWEGLFKAASGAA